MRFPPPWAAHVVQLVYASGCLIVSRPNESPLSAIARVHFRDVSDFVQKGTFLVGRVMTPPSSGAQPIARFKESTEFDRPCLRRNPSIVTVL